MVYIAHVPGLTSVASFGARELEARLREQLAKVERMGREVRIVPVVPDPSLEAEKWQHRHRSHWDKRLPLPDSVWTYIGSVNHSAAREELRQRFGRMRRGPEEVLAPPPPASQCCGDGDSRMRWRQSPACSSGLEVGSPSSPSSSSSSKPPEVETPATMEPSTPAASSTTSNEDSAAEESIADDDDIRDDDSCDFRDAEEGDPVLEDLAAESEEIRNEAMDSSTVGSDQAEEFVELYNEEEVRHAQGPLEAPRGESEGETEAAGEAQAPWVGAPERCGANREAELELVIDDEAVERAIRAGISAPLQERVLKRAYYRWLSGSYDEKGNYYEALRVELLIDALEERRARGLPLGRQL